MTEIIAFMYVGYYKVSPKIPQELVGDKYVYFTNKEHDILPIKQGIVKIKGTGLWALSHDFLSKERE